MDSSHELASIYATDFIIRLYLILLIDVQTYVRLAAVSSYMSAGNKNISEQNKIFILF
jgi:hypothetical protein